MSELNGSGIEYPKIELGGVVHAVKFTEYAQYKMSKLGIAFAPEFLNEGKQYRIGFSNLVDVLALCIDWKGSTEELCRLAYPKAKRDEIGQVLMAAWGNLLLSSGEVKIRETAAPAATDRSELTQ
jgi:hypothetical protein